jgi:hypothetical protein
MNNTGEKKLLLRDSIIVSIAILAASQIVESTAALYGPIYIAYAILDGRFAVEMGRVPMIITYIYFILGGTVYIFVLMFVIGRIFTGHRKRLLAFAIVLLAIGIMSSRLGGYIFWPSLRT